MLHQAILVANIRFFLSLFSAYTSKFALVMSCLLFCVSLFTNANVINIFHFYAATVKCLDFFRNLVFSLYLFIVFLF